MRWQANKFRSSQNASRVLHSPFPAGYKTLKGTFVAHSVVLTTEFHTSQSWAPPRSEIITPKLVSLPRGALRVLRNSICCQSDPRETLNKSPLGPESVFSTGAEELAAQELLVHRLEHPSRSEVRAAHVNPAYLARQDLLLSGRQTLCAVCYRLREISEMAVRPDSISSGVLKWEKLKRTTPLSAVPRALCMSGAQWAPGRVQMP